MARRGNGGRKRKRGRPSKAQQAARAATGPTLKDKADFILKHRFLMVKNTSAMDRQQWDDLVKMFEYYDQLGLSGNPNVLRWLLSRESTSLEIFIDRIVKEANAIY